MWAQGADSGDNVVGPITRRRSSTGSDEVSRQVKRRRRTRRAGAAWGDTLLQRIVRPDHDSLGPCGTQDRARNDVDEGQRRNAQRERGKTS